MAQQQPRYYIPYDSGDESDSSRSDSSRSYTTTSTQSSADDKPNFSQLAANLYKSSGYSTITQDASVPYLNFNDPLVPDAFKQENLYGTTKFATEASKDTTIITLDSQNRDKSIYTQPSYCVFRFPRNYKNITTLSVAEIKLLTSFYFFNKTKNNTDITIYEDGRTNIIQGNTVSNIIKSYIPNGSYSIATLTNQIQTTLNTMSIFYDFVGGYNEFVEIFSVSNDFSIIFNQPGDYFYNRMTDTYIPNPTINYILSYFWININYVNVDSYSDKQLLVIYYYPVLKEILLDTTIISEILNPSFSYINVININLQSGIGIDSSIQTIADVRHRCLYTIQVLSDSIIYAVIINNRTVLDNYRLQHTMRYGLVNKYSITVNPQSQNISISSSSLNTSLINLIAIQQSKYLAQILGTLGTTLTNYSNVISISFRLFSVLKDLHNFNQTQFLKYFGVPWNQYNYSYYANSSNPFFIQNGLNSLNIPSNLAESIQAGIVSISSSIFQQKEPNPSFWPSFTTTTPTIEYINLSNTVDSYNNVYRETSKTIDIGQSFVDPVKNTIYSQLLTTDATAVCPIQSGKYTVFKFTTPVRQTIQVETRSRPIQYRLPQYNQSNYSSTINSFFNFPYIFQSNLPYISRNNFQTIYDTIQSNAIQQIQGWASNNNSWGVSYISSLYNTSNYELSIRNTNGALYLQFTTPPVSNASVNSNYTYPMNISFACSYGISTFQQISPALPLSIFMYQDRGAFMGDITCNRNENPYFYKYSSQISNNPDSLSTATISFITYPNQTYYVTIRPESFSYPKLFVNAVPWFSSSFQVTPQSLGIDGLNPASDIFQSNFSTLVTTNYNYAQVYDSNWLKLPIGISTNTITPLIQYSNLPTNITSIGYDTNGVSTDYTDYIPYITNSKTGGFYPSNTIAIDPITQYIFQLNSRYNTSNQAYLYQFTNNIIFSPGLDQTYTETTVSNRQYKIAHYYSVNYIPESIKNITYFDPTYISDSNSQLPYSLDTTYGNPIPGYSYDGPNNELQLDKGVLGFTFIPGKGVWDIKQFVFRSAVSDYANDPNQYIRYLGIYLFSDIINTNTYTLSMSTAIMVLSNSTRVTYTSNATQTSEGFDTKGGTYYEFKKDTTFVNPSPYYSNILGYAQNPGSIVSQPESMYACVGFTEFGNAVTIKGLSGSVVPYPYYNKPFVSTCYLDGTKSYYANKGVVFPSTIGQTNWPTETENSNLFAPIGDPTQSQYEQSIPIGTSVLLYKQQLDILVNGNLLNPWTVPIRPITINGNVNNFMLVQDTQINIYPYNDFLTNRSFAKTTWSYTTDQIFNESEKTSLVGITGDEYKYYFLGFANTETSTILRLKEFNPTLGEMKEIPLNQSYTIPKGGTVKSFSMNNLNQIVLIYQDTNDITGFYYTTNNITTTTLQAAYISSLSTAVHTMNSDNSTIYWLQLGTNEMGQTIYEWNLSSPFPGIKWTSSNSNVYWNNLCMNSSNTIPALRDRLFLANTISSYQDTIWVTDVWNFSNNKFNIITVSKPDFLVETLNSGYKGSVWFTEKQNNIIWGNRNSEIDIPGKITGAWQIFYPFQKIVLEKVDSINIPSNDSLFPEYGHTQIFYYNSILNFCNDINLKWGLESNAIQADTKFSGYYYNSRIKYIPISKDVGNNNFLAIRGYSPTESFETMLHCVIPNKYTFGYVTINEMINEINICTQPEYETQFDVDYKNILLEFNSKYNQSNTFGANVFSNFDGIQITTSDFTSFIQAYNSNFAVYSTNTSLINTVNNFINSNMNIYISTHLQYILPPEKQTYFNFNTPVSFKILWNSALLPQYKKLSDNWGLGYNLGFKNTDSILSLVQQAQSFYKILDDYIYLRISPEYNINTLDITEKEQLNITRDSTGSIGKYFGKLLLGDFNTYSRTFVSNQVLFNPPISRLDKLSFEWLDSNGIVIDNADCDWSLSLVVTENVVRQTADSTLISIPAAAANTK